MFKTISTEYSGSKPWQNAALNPKGHSQLIDYLPSWMIRNQCWKIPVPQFFLAFSLILFPFPTLSCRSFAVSLGSLGLCSAGSGSRTVIRSQPHCLAGKMRIILITFSYLHATMRKDRMSELFRKISPYRKKNTSICLLSPFTYISPNEFALAVCVLCF